MLDGLYQIDRYYLEHFAYFLGKLRATPEGDGTMLDRTMVMYGSGMNSELGGSHSGKNLPLLLAGGKSLGFKLGQHLAFDDSVPLCNLLLTVAGLPSRRPRGPTTCCPWPVLRLRSIR
jgi:hypothetical protein